MVVITKTMARRRRDYIAKQRQQRSWKSKNGPVTIRKATEQELAGLSVPSLQLR